MSDHDTPTADHEAEGPALDLDPEIIDLDAARAARNFAAKRPVAIRIGGELFHCEPELPVLFVENIAAERASLAFAALLVDETKAAALIGQISMEDLQEVADGIARFYGVTLGKSGRPGS